LAAGIAHDFNNVLAAIQFAAASLATLLPMHQDGHEELSDIRDSARRGAALTQQLLTFSRDRAVVPQRVLLGAVVRDVLPMLRRLVPADVRIDVHIDETPLPTLAAASHLERVLSNLCQNASDAMRGSGTIAIRVTRAAAGANSALRPGCAYAELSVSDTGAGMNDEVRQRLFEPFFTTKTGGTGLGLANVYAIVQQCLGHIEVSSELGAGSSFRIWLPLAHPLAADAVGGPLDARSSRETVLVVDDDETARRGLERILKRAGYHVLAARDGAHALNVVAEFEGLVDLTITDVHMPGMTGAQLAAALRERAPEMQLVFISGDAAESLLASGLLAAREPFLRKPVTEAELLQLLNQLLELPDSASREHSSSSL
jgi:CheY-like chemotaxis protein